jgi:hypothetical protein
LGITVAIGIFIHNVPEGIAISGKFWGINRESKDDDDDEYVSVVVRSF